ncbi:3591_t:CDS:2 [Funneliformis mosseae]|uniref:3591_t:CDS:1 n=1 Tax=Funneliformis mosseae TaxID=27381 RepID=A0A9N9BZJ8_FUNMO|nr:3591_t:CDS:2 [Funneliformis mosseae]
MASVDIHFGTTYSGFAYANKINPDEIDTNTRWLGREGLPKTNTALLYDADCIEVLKWGEPALLQEKRRRKSQEKAQKVHIIERFKLHLDDMMKQKPFLPSFLDYKKAIIDYLIKMKGVIEETLFRTWPDLSLRQVLFVLSVPAEWPPPTRAILRDCAFQAGLIDEDTHSNLEFTTEPEAAAIHCLSVCNQHGISESDTFLVVDCGGGTVDLTVRTLLENNKLREETVRTGGLCGSTFVDEEFLKFLGRVVGIRALAQFKEQAYGDLQKLIYRFFCQHVKLPFTGDPDEFETIELDLQVQCSTLIQYITGAAKINLTDEDWVVELDYDDIKHMFDPAINEIIKLIDAQLNSVPRHLKIKAMFLVGGFSESLYLTKRIKETFHNRVPKIAFPRQPVAAIAKGAVSYGLNMQIIDSRIIPWTFGIEISDDFDPQNDPETLKTQSGRIWRFDPIVQQGERLKVNEERSKLYQLLQKNQDAVSFKIFYTKLKDPRFPYQPDVNFLGKLRIILSDKHLFCDSPVEFSLMFAKEEIKATARNGITNNSYHTTFKYPFETGF